MTFEAFDESRRLNRFLRLIASRLRSRNADLFRQLRRAATSVTLNIAEGSARTGQDQKHHYRIARGSAKEVQAILWTAEDWGDVPSRELKNSHRSVDRLLRLLWGLS